MATPDDFLAQAVKLLKSAANDADYRTVITQAYYGGYHSARLFEEQLPQQSTIDTSKMGSHEGLIQRLECPNPKLDYGLRIISQDIGNQLRQLKALREIASYELEDSVDVNQAEAAIEGAKEIMSECTKGNRKISATATGKGA